MSLARSRLKKKLLIGPNRRVTLLSSLACGISMTRRTESLAVCVMPMKGQELQALSGFLLDRSTYPETAMISETAGFVIRRRPATFGIETLHAERT